MSALPHSFSLRQLQYALAVGDTLSFRKAAERCHVSQPSLSSQLALLEGVLGVRLFERDTRRVLPTPAGQALLERARQIVLAADDLVLAARQAADPLSGTLRVGVIPTVSPYLLPSVSPALLAAHKRLAVRWIEDKTDVLVQRLHEGTLDAALLALEAELGEVEHELIARDPFVLVTPRDHALGRAHGRLHARDLRGAEVLLLDDGHCFRDQALSVCQKARVEEQTFRATSLSTLAQMVASGAGITLLPSLAVSTEARRAKLRVRSFAAPEPGRTIALVWRRRSPLDAALRRLGRTIRDAYPTA
jgi:LysR family hydrogen peroxide-inducible transcriptional activator